MALSLVSCSRKKHSKSIKMGAGQSSPSSYCSSSPRNHTKAGPCDVISIILRSRSKDKFRELIQGLVYNSGNVNALGEHGMTALHYAVLSGEELIIKALVAFGAHVNVQNDFTQTPLDLAIENNKDKTVPLLVSVGCKQARVLKNVSTSGSAVSPDSPPCNEGNPVESGLKRAKHVLADQIEECLRERMLCASSTLTPNDAYVVLLQQRELQRFKEANGEKCDLFEPEGTPPPIEFESQGGARILSLDGGGMRGLIQLEILFEIERLTGKRIVELFDWIIGNSIGGIMALALVYANMSLNELRRLYFRIKDEVFASKIVKIGGYNTKALEKLLQEELGTEVKMSDIQKPKVLITAVDKSNTPMNIHYFNNCFDEDFFSTQPVWKVARYTSAAPLYFTELDNYVDGGVMANNPCEGGLAKIQSSYMLSKNQRIPVACLVSVGSGLFPPNPLGAVGIFGVQNLLRMLSDALGQSETIADRCKNSCEAQNIPFYRFSPPLDIRIEPTETDSRKLVDIMITSRMYMHSIEEYSVDKLLPLLLQQTNTL